MILWTVPKKITGGLNVLELLDPNDRNFSLGAENKFSLIGFSEAVVAFIFN